MCDYIDSATYKVKKVRDILELMSDNLDRLKADIVLMQISELDDVIGLLDMGQEETERKSNQCEELDTVEL